MQIFSPVCHSFFGLEQNPELSCQFSQNKENFWNFYWYYIGILNLKVYMHGPPFIFFKKQDRENVKKRAEIR